ncbi:hypothetical protein DFP72DRAFT_861135 [Ephemerocybe angulata]|uniref:Chromo domain-containing protein n=1 Tax=Ephemerocybe angulata TaxID=980116 RepID=A0A8H6H7Y2_9AGAR|nr:hypothetical protein DFP72DRAFT_861135 [Tulosesus angulatus]
MSVIVSASFYDRIWVITDVTGLSHLLLESSWTVYWTGRTPVGLNICRTIPDSNLAGTGVQLDLTGLCWTLSAGLRFRALLPPYQTKSPPEVQEVHRESSKSTGLLAKEAKIINSEEEQIVERIIAEKWDPEKEEHLFFVKWLGFNAQEGNRLSSFDLTNAADTLREWYRLHEPACRP